MAESGNNAGDRIAAVVLAAGEASRFGEPKQLAVVHGEPMIAKVVREVAASKANTVIVVLGFESDRVRPALAGFAGLKIVENPDYGSGLASSLKAGLARAGGFDAAMFVLGDLPGLGTHHLDSVICAYRESCAPLALGVIENRPAHPVVFRKDLWGELEELTGDVGGREVARRHLTEAIRVELPNAAGTDIDTPEDHVQLTGGYGSE